MKNQSTKILYKLIRNKGKWINGRYFNNTMMISQYHARIYELQAQGHKIKASSFRDKFNFKSYMLT